MSNPGVIAALVVAVFTALANLFIAWRRARGTIRSSEATELWKASESIRTWATQRIEELNDELARCRDRMDRLEKRNDALTKENGELKRMLEQHERTIDTLRAEVVHLRAENVDLKAANVVLRSRVSELEDHDESAGRPN